MKQNLQELYNLPSRVIFCTNCTMSNQRPRITFNSEGVCSACTFSNYKKKVDWSHRNKELLKLCDKFRRNNGEYDVVVPCSGGKDGSFVAHQLKEIYGMNPLCVTWSPLSTTDIGKANLDNFIQSGFHHILGTPDPITTRKLTKLSFKHIGDPFQPFIYGQTNFPLRMAVQHGIQLIMYGENGEVEYGGDMKNAEVPTREIGDHDRHYFSNFPPEAWSKFGLTAKDLKPFMAPGLNEILANNTEIHFLSYYKNWDPQENFYYCSKNTGFKPNPDRSQGTYSKYASLDDKFDGFHYYLGYIKFGIGRATADTAHEIRDMKISREEGIALVRKFDHEFPSKFYSDFLDYIDISEQEFAEVIDSWRSEHIWHRSKGEWKLNNPIWED